MDAQKRQKDDLSARYISLTAASALVYHAATDAITDDAATLNDLARIIATRTQVLARDMDGEPFSRVWPRAIFEGRFEDGGKYLCFADGRPTIRNLAIAESEMTRLIPELRPLVRRAQ